MARAVAVQMDPMESINFAIDSTISLGLEAQRRGYELYYYTPSDLSCLDGEVLARACPLRLTDGDKRSYEMGEAQQLALKEMDVVLFRQDPPFDMGYISTTYLLERIHPHTLVVNNPTSVRNCPEKLIPFTFGQFMPPTLISADKQAILDFRRKYKDIVIKPLYSFSGHSIFHIKPDDDNLTVLLEMVFANAHEPLVVQKFLPEVKTRDCRVMIADGEVIGAFGRLPREGEIRANFHAGGTLAPVELTSEQLMVCEAVGPVVKELGLIFVGLDFIGHYLTEINMTCPAGIFEANQIMGIRSEEPIWDAIERCL